MFLGHDTPQIPWLTEKGHTPVCLFVCLSVCLSAYLIGVARNLSWGHSAEFVQFPWGSISRRWGKVWVGGVPGALPEICFSF